VFWVESIRHRETGTSAIERRLSDGNRPSANADANNYYERALLFGGAGSANPDQAQRMIERALSADPKFAAARAEYAFSHVVRIVNGRSNEAGLFYKAETEVRQALRDDARWGRAHSVLALIYLLQGRKELVPGELDKALKENPTDPTAHSWLLDYHRLNGDYPRAREKADWLIRTWPLFWPGHLQLGELLREQGDLAGAIRKQEEVLEQNPQNPDALAALTATKIGGITNFDSCVLYCSPLKAERAKRLRRWMAGSRPTPGCRCSDPHWRQISTRSWVTQRELSIGWIARSVWVTTASST
jgi:tetratricopeptide (TPR) repeat protein